MGKKIFNILIGIMLIIALRGYVFGGVDLGAQRFQIEKREKIAKVRLPFIENKRQYPEDVRFYANTL